MRETFNDGDEIRDEGLTTPEDVERFDGISYGPDRKWNTLDVYRPKNHSGRLPVIISFHGGGWVYGDKESCQYYCVNSRMQLSVKFDIWSERLNSNISASEYPYSLVLVY